MGSEITLETSAPRSPLTEFGRVIAVNCAVMALAMLVDYFVNDKVGIISNITLLAMSVVTAVRVSAGNFLVAVWAPVLAWHVAVFTTGQLTRPMNGSLITQELFLILYAIANHAWWVLGATVLAALIVSIRRRKAT